MNLRQRLTAAFVLCALVATACFSLLGVMFIYTVEDRFLDQMLEQEAKGVATPLRPDLRFYRELKDFPADLAPQFDGEIKPGEYFGDEGRHYHVRKAGAGYMVAEVSSQLVVRPRLPAILTMLAVMAAIMLLLIGGAGYLFARRATAPLEHLAGMLDKSDAHHLPRGFSQGFEVDEIGKLARALDAGMERVSAFVAREQDFTRDASHELRTPLAVIGGAAALMETETLSDQGRAQLRRIRDACALMQRSTETLLALSREQSLPSVTAALPILPLIESAVVRCAYLLEGKEVDVQVDVPSHAVFALDQGVLEVLLANLVGNAFSHTEAGQVRIAMDGPDLTVENTGSIPAGLDDRVFLPGIKSDTSRGYGLGLPIAHRLAVQSGVQLTINSARGLVTARMTKGTP